MFCLTARAAFIIFIAPVSAPCGARPPALPAALKARTEVRVRAFSLVMLPHDSRKTRNPAIGCEASDGGVTRFGTGKPGVERHCVAPTGVGYAPRSTTGAWAPKIAWAIFCWRLPHAFGIECHANLQEGLQA